MLPDLSRSRVALRARLVLWLLPLAGCGNLDALINSAIVESVEVVPDSATMLVGEGLQLKAVLRDGVDTVLIRRPTWTSLDPVVIEVDLTGWVVGRGVGTGRVRAEADGRQDVARIRVVP